MGILLEHPVCDDVIVACTPSVLALVLVSSGIYLRIKKANSNPYWCKRQVEMLLDNTTTNIEVNWCKVLPSIRMCRGYTHRKLYDHIVEEGGVEVLRVLCSVKEEVDLYCLVEGVMESAIKHDDYDTVKAIVEGGFLSMCDWDGEGESMLDSLVIYLDKDVGLLEGKNITENGTPFTLSGTITILEDNTRAKREVGEYYRCELDVPRVDWSYFSTPDDAGKPYVEHFAYDLAHDFSYLRVFVVLMEKGLLTRKDGAEILSTMEYHASKIVGKKIQEMRDRFSLT